MPKITEAGVQGALNALYSGSLDDTALLELRLVAALHREMRLPDALPVSTPSYGVDKSPG